MLHRPALAGCQGLPEAPVGGTGHAQSGKPGSSGSRRNAALYASHAAWSSLLKPESGITAQSLARSCAATDASLSAIAEACWALAGSSETTVSPSCTSSPGAKARNASPESAYWLPAIFVPPDINEGPGPRGRRGVLVRECPPGHHRKNRRALVCEACVPGCQPGVADFWHVDKELQV